jgi:hypothetical protein
MSLRGLWACLREDKEIRFSLERAEEIINRNQAQSWFIYILKDRAHRWDVWQPCLWLAPRISRNTKILETGCGCAWNMIWFGQQGFRKLNGFDIDSKAIAAGKELCAEAGVPANLYVDDGLSPSKLQSNTYGVILAVNWTHLLDAFDITAFCRQYSVFLRRGGYIIIDVIDAAYNNTPNNEYLTSDWKLPLEQRRPTEYKKRYSGADVRKAAETAGLVILRTMTRSNMTVPRCVYVMQLPRRKTG